MKLQLVDPLTGRKLWQLTGGAHTHYAPYTYRQAFSHDEHFVIFTSDLSL